MSWVWHLNHAIKLHLKSYLLVNFAKYPKICNLKKILFSAVFYLIPLEFRFWSLMMEKNPHSHIWTTTIFLRAHSELANIQVTSASLRLFAGQRLCLSLYFGSWPQHRFLGVQHFLHIKFSQVNNGTEATQIRWYHPCFINEKNGDTTKLRKFKVWDNIQDFQLCCFFGAPAFPRRC